MYTYHILPPAQKKKKNVGSGLLLLVDVLLIETVDDNAYCLVDGMEDWYCECILWCLILTLYDDNNNRCGDGELWQTIAKIFAIQPPFSYTEKKEMEFITPIDKVVGWVEKHNNLLYGRIAAGTVRLVLLPGLSNCYKLFNMSDYGRCGGERGDCNARACWVLIEIWIWVPVVCCCALHGCWIGRRR